jgi:predicted ribosomally synthesized peptide with nif11-like leader
MSAEGAKAFYERVTSDEEFRAQFEAAATPEEKNRIVTEAGYEVNRDDVNTLRKLHGLGDGGPLRLRAGRRAAGGSLRGGAPGGESPTWRRPRLDDRRSPDSRRHDPAESCRTCSL